MPISSKVKSFIYCRVSSARQVSQGNGLSSQETRCREYASYKGYDVVKVFQDDMTGKIAKRPAMVSMLAHLRKHRNERCVVIIDDISRLARGLEAHLELRALISKAGGKLESPSIEFGEDSDSLLVENMLASVAQHQREKNGEQTKNRMRARMMNGYWVFQPPVGYVYEKRPGHGNIMVRDEPVASIIAEALEGYASGRLDSKVEVKRFLESMPDFPKSIRNTVTFRTVDQLLTRQIYAGIISWKSWGLDNVDGRHEPIISFETYQANQNKTRALAKAPSRKDLHEDFPLRGFVTCGCCEEPMTGYWSKGRNKKYPYYMCFNKGCEEFRKSIRKEAVEEAFEAFLGALKPSEELFYMSFHMFRDMWEDRMAAAKKQQTSLKREVTRLDRKVEQFLERVVETGNATLIRTYENKIDELESQKRILTEKIGNCGRPLPNFEATFRTAFDFLSNPQKLWISERFEDKRAVLKLVFTERIPYHRKSGFRTTKTTLPFKALADFSEGECPMAERVGFEPTVRVAHNGFRDRPVRPLRHLSASHGAWSV